MILVILVFIILVIFFTVHKPNLSIRLHNSNYDSTYEKYDVQTKFYHYPNAYIFKTFTQSAYPGVYKTAIKLQKYFGVNKNVYGIKSCNGEFSFEFYYYYPKENTLHTVSDIATVFNLPVSGDDKNYYLVSFDIDPRNPDTVKELNLYYTLNNCDHNTPYSYHSHEICKQCKMSRSVTFDIYTRETVDKNVYKFFYRNSNVEDIFKYTRSLLKQDVDMNLIFPSYLMNFKKFISISSKHNGSLGVYFNLISFDDLITFLNKTGFSKSLESNLLKVRTNISYLLFDIGMDVRVIDFDTIEISKIALYGIL